MNPANIAEQTWVATQSVFKAAELHLIKLYKNPCNNCDA